MLVALNNGSSNNEITLELLVSQLEITQTAAVYCGPEVSLMFIYTH